MRAARDGRPRTRITWLLRQLADAPDNLRIEVRYPNAKKSASSTLKEARANPDRLLYPADIKREPRSFRVAITKKLGGKREKGPGSFVLEAKLQTSDFYRLIVQRLRPWTATAPKLPSSLVQSVSSEEASPEPPPFTSPEREFGQATEPRS